MTIIEALEIIKPEAKDEDSLKRAYRALCKQYHPDINPNGLELMKLINSAYDMLLTQWSSWTLSGFKPSESSILDEILAKFEAIKHCMGINAEVCGSWLWLTGNTKAYRHIFKAEGFKWSNNKGAWYWHPSSYSKRSRKVFDLNTIRTMWGSVGLETEPLTAMA